MNQKPRSAGRTCSARSRISESCSRVNGFGLQRISYRIGGDSMGSARLRRGSLLGVNSHRASLRALEQHAESLLVMAWTCLVVWDLWQPIWNAIPTARAVYTPSAVISG